MVIIGYLNILPVNRRNHNPEDTVITASLPVVHTNNLFYKNWYLFFHHLFNIRHRYTNLDTHSSQIFRVGENTTGSDNESDKSSTSFKRCVIMVG